MLSFAPVADATEFAYSAVTWLSEVLAPIGGATAGVVLFTLVVRLLLHPLTRAAVRGERARAVLAPQLAALRERHGKDPVAFSQAMTELYRGAGVSPFAGILPMLLQAPAFIVLYQLFVRTSISGHANTLLDSTLSGVPLGAHLLVPAGGPHLAVFGLLLAALAGLAWLSARRAVKLASLQPKPPTGLLAALPRLLPYAILISAAVLPLAAGLYLLTSTAWTVAENTALRRGMPVPAPA
ncbi:protein translocase component YidC [Catellatospora sp. TT07R-123]|uniref:YidC/Oxa1 family membrane protein insertase n=1 Tax=Catellatospora sp. TT07R-123 TaxID=2733863 RepID=UPI001AFF9C57|nr:membrane protein insertase YidC [Catellatospora sp. TT07R-123]GHJ49411.1 protein translocase component YidC [Catellatospora sp. TT07R-123]